MRIEAGAEVSPRRAGRPDKSEKMEENVVNAENYKKILDMLPETKIYVVREDDHRVLYFNQAAAQEAQNARVGMLCSEGWSAYCEFCPLKDMGDKQENRVTGHSEAFGGLVEMTASRLLWDGSIPAIAVAVHREQERLKTLQERAYIIGSLSSMFFSTYYVDLENDTFRVVTQLGRIGDVLGDEVNCSAALKIYAENFIHPEDREEYLQVMNVENLRQSLGWWNPYVVYEYRMIPEDGKDDPERTGWTRATAVLAQAGEDGSPKTVVYVAQDVTESKRRQVREERARREARRPEEETGGEA